MIPGEFSPPQAGATILQALLNFVASLLTFFVGIHNIRMR